MRIGVLGGTFDPPHLGHLALARAALAALELDEVLFVPTSRNPMKLGVKASSGRHRLAMVQAMIAGEPKMAACDVEVVRGGLSYAVETMTELSVAQPGEYWFLVGADAGTHIAEWKQPQRLLRLCRLGVAVRPPVDEATLLRRVPVEFHDRIDIIPMTPVEVSSTEVRDRLQAGRPVNRIVTEPVYAYIQQHHLYSA
ncbi:MAG TPA: nicotinate-nucleotide adenylyltransferase [Fimbriimonadaceae bacterium]|nr:nicotinate-nucleotide adenylyltransferase [Fimbriimonadaceae bacterium]